MRIILTIAILTLAGLTAAAQQPQQLRVGSDAPAFAAEALDGRLLSLPEMEGKVVVMTFWSTKCAICHSEIPKLNLVAKRYEGQDVVFLALTMENSSRIQPYLQKNPFNFTIVPNSFGVVLKFADMDSGGRMNIGFPAHFLIGRDGKIAHRTNGFDKASNIDAQISRLLNE
ncbi:TlpA disulfide reductase family protein [soil metagenome]